MAMDLEKVTDGQSGALALHVEHGTSLAMPAAHELVAYKDSAAIIFRSGMFKQYKSMESVFVGMLYLRELGANLISGLRAGYVIEDKFDVEVKVKLGGFQSKLPSFEWEPIEWDVTVCRIKARLSKGHPWHEMKFTRADADSAGYSKTRDGGVKDNWKGSKAKEMLLWRTLTRWMNTYGAHILYAMPTVIQQDAEDDTPHMRPIEGRAEVVEEESPVISPGASGTEGPGQTLADPATGEGGEPAPAASPSGPTDFGKATRDLLQKNGYAPGSAQLRLIGLLFVKWGLAIPKKYAEITTDEWRRLYETLTGPNMDWTKVPKLDDKPAAAEATASAAKPDAAAEARSRLAELLRARPDESVWCYHPSGSSNLWIIHQGMLEACGEHDTALVASEDAARQSHLIGEALSIMLERAIKEHYGSAEDDTQVDRPQMGAKAKSDLANRRDG